MLASYSDDGMSEIIGVLHDESPDIITLQEVQQKTDYDQAAIIASALGYEYYFHDSVSDSHIDTDCRLGNAIISRHPLSRHAFKFFDNPHVQTKWEDGTIATSFDKGYTRCTASVDTIEVEIVSLHLMPFRRFGVELSSSLARKVIRDVTNKLVLSSEHLLVQGDFNINAPTLRPYFEELFATQTLNELTLNEPTTPKGRMYDKQRMENQKSAPKLGRAPPQKRISIKRHLDDRVQTKSNQRGTITLWNTFKRSRNGQRGNRHGRK